MHNASRDDEKYGCIIRRRAMLFFLSHWLMLIRKHNRGHSASSGEVLRNARDEPAFFVDALRHRCSSGIIRGASKVANSDLNTESRVLILTACGKKFIPAPKIESNGSTKRNGEMTGPNSNFDSKTAANITRTTRIPRRNVKNARDKADRSEIARCTLPG